MGLCGWGSHPLKTHLFGAQLLDPAGAELVSHCYLCLPGDQTSQPQGKCSSACSWLQTWGGGREWRSRAAKEGLVMVQGCKRAPFTEFASSVTKALADFPVK